MTRRSPRSDGTRPSRWRCAWPKSRSTRIYVSTLQRTAQTAAPLVARTGMTPVVDPDLREVFLGEWEGGLLRQKATDNDPLFQRVMAEQRWDLIPGAESRAGLRWPPAAGRRAHRGRAPGRARRRLQPRRGHRRDPGPGHGLGAVRLRGRGQRIDLEDRGDAGALDRARLQRHRAPDRLRVVARIVLVHGAFNELWGPNELKARWLPAVRDGLWHHGVDLAEATSRSASTGTSSGVIRERTPTASSQQSRAGVADALADLQDGEAIKALGQAVERSGVRPHRRHDHDDDDGSRACATDSSPGSSRR